MEQSEPSITEINGDAHCPGEIKGDGDIFYLQDFYGDIVRFSRNIQLLVAKSDRYGWLNFQILLVILEKMADLPLQKRSPTPLISAATSFSRPGWAADSHRQQKSRGTGTFIHYAILLEALLYFPAKIFFRPSNPIQTISCLLKYCSKISLKIDQREYKNGPRPL